MQNGLMVQYRRQWQILMLAELFFRDTPLGSELSD